VATIPTLHAVRGGFSATCGKCLVSSDGVAADSPESAWLAIQASGWTLHKHGYPLCLACTKDPPNVDKDAARAMKSRKRK